MVIFDQKTGHFVEYKSREDFDHEELGIIKSMANFSELKREIFTNDDLDFLQDMSLTQKDFDEKFKNNAKDGKATSTSEQQEPVRKKRVKKYVSKKRPLENSESAEFPQEAKEVEKKTKDKVSTVSIPILKKQQPELKPIKLKPPPASLLPQPTQAYKKIVLGNQIQQQELDSCTSLNSIALDEAEKVENEVTPKFTYAPLQNPTTPSYILKQYSPYGNIITPLDKMRNIPLDSLEGFIIKPRVTVA